MCPPGSNLCGDPHMQGLRGQSIDWAGVDGGWYCLIRDDLADIHVNVRLTAPLPDEFPDRQLITGVSVMSEGHSLVIQVKNPYAVDPFDGCPDETSPCLANGALRVEVDGNEGNGQLLGVTRDEHVVEGMDISASNLPVECRQFGGHTIWARMYEEMLQGTRQLTSESFEDWVLLFDNMAAPEWCAKYVAERSLLDVQSTHAIFRIMTSDVTVRLNVGVDHQGKDGTEPNWDGRTLPELDFWQMDVGLDGLDIENPALSGILGETARPVLGEDGREVLEGLDALRGSVEDYRVSGPCATSFVLFDDNKSENDSAGESVEKNRESGALSTNSAHIVDEKLSDNISRRLTEDKRVSDPGAKDFALVLDDEESFENEEAFQAVIEYDSAATNFALLLDFSEVSEEDSSDDSLM